MKKIYLKIKKFFQDIKIQKEYEKSMDSDKEFNIGKYF